MKAPLLTPEQEVAFQELYSLVESEARRLVTSPRASDFDRDDARQVGSIALCNAIREHETERGPIKPWCRMAIRHAIIDAFRVACGREPDSVRRRLAGASQLNDEVCVSDNNTLVSHDIKDSVQAALDWFEPLERKLIEMHYLQCMKLEDVGAKVGMSVSRVCQIINKAIAQLRQEAQRLPSEWRQASRSGQYKIVAGDRCTVRLFDGEGRREDGDASFGSNGCSGGNSVCEDVTSESIAA